MPFNDIECLKNCSPAAFEKSLNKIKHHSFFFLQKSSYCGSHSLKVKMHIAGERLHKRSTS